MAAKKHRIYFDVTRDMMDLLEAHSEATGIKIRKIYQKIFDEWFEWVEEEASVGWMPKKAPLSGVRVSFGLTDEQLAIMNGLAPFQPKDLGWDAIVRYVYSHDLLTRSYDKTPAQLKVKLGEDYLEIIDKAVASGRFDSSSSFAEIALTKWIRLRSKHQGPWYENYANPFRFDEKSGELHVLLERDLHSAVANWADKDNVMLVDIYFNAIRIALDELLDESIEVTKASDVPESS